MCNGIDGGTAAPTGRCHRYRAFGKYEIRRDGLHSCSVWKCGQSSVWHRCCARSWMTVWWWNQGSINRSQEGNTGVTGFIPLFHTTGARQILRIYVPKTRQSHSACSSSMFWLLQYWVSKTTLTLDSSDSVHSEEGQCTAVALLLTILYLGYRFPFFSFRGRRTTSSNRSNRLLVSWLDFFAVLALVRF